MHRDHYTQASVVGREVGAHVSLGLGDKATMDLMHSDALNEDRTWTGCGPPARRSSPRAGAP
jgi:hypothetical protein